MTTIVYDHKKQQIAVDGRVIAGGDILTESCEKWIYDKADLWFLCGSTADSSWFIDAHRSGEPIKGEFHPGCSGLLVRDGKVYSAGIDSNGCPWICESSFNRPSGSGGGWAIAALDLVFECTAEEAVKYAHKKDSATGYNVFVYDIETAKFL